MNLTEYENAWGAPRSEEVGQAGTPLLNSYEWGGIGRRAREGAPLLLWAEWLQKTKEDQWLWLGSLNTSPRRRLVMGRTEELGGKGGRRHIGEYRWGSRY